MHNKTSVFVRGTVISYGIFSVISLIGIQLKPNRVTVNERLVTELGKKVGGFSTL
jgi:hypothetical protein